MKKIIVSIFAMALISAIAFAQTSQELPKLPNKAVNIIIMNDTGSKVDSQRVATKELAAAISDIIRNNRISFIAIAGDIIHDKGVQSADDPEWEYKVKQIFDEKPLKHTPWFVVPGNHEYKGVPSAIVAHASTTPKWRFKSLYYEIDRRIPRSKDKVSFFFLDTMPMIESKAADNKNIPEGYLQEELAWADSSMAASDAKWKIAFGHHPVYAHTGKKVEEKQDMERNLLPILDKNSVNFYICGHIHNFQYIVPEGSTTRYIVNSSGARTRTPKPIDGTVFCKGTVGCTLMSVTDEKIDFYFLNQKGEVLYHGDYDSSL